MSHQIILQPDGLLCVWSDVVDCLILVDATPEELSQYYARAAYEQAKQATDRLTDLVLAGNARKVYHQSTMTYEDVAIRSDTTGKGRRRKRLTP